MSKRNKDKGMNSVNVKVLNILQILKEDQDIALVIHRCSIRNKVRIYLTIEESFNGESFTVFVNFMFEGSSEVDSVELDRVVSIDEIYKTDVSIPLWAAFKKQYRSAAVAVILVSYGALVIRYENIYEFDIQFMIGDHVSGATADVAVYFKDFGKVD